MRGEERRLGLRAALADRVDERHHGLAHGVEEVVAGAGVHAALVLVEPHVVGVARGVHIAGVALERLDDAVHVGLKARPVVGVLRLVPHGVGLAGQAAPRLDLLGWQRAGLALVAGEGAHLRRDLRVGELAGGHGGLELGDERAGVLTGKELVMLAGKRAHRIAARGRPVLGRDGGAVEHGDLHKVLAGPELGLERAKARGELFGGGVRHESSLRVECGHCL